VRLFTIYKWFPELQKADHEYKALIDRGVAILLSKNYSNEVKFTFSENIVRVMKCEIKTETDIFQISNNYAPNIPTDRENLLESLLISIRNQNDDSVQHYEIILGDFNCVLFGLNHDSNYYLHPHDFSIQISIDQY
jgi:hypothetical protein